MDTGTGDRELAEAVRTLLRAALAHRPDLAASIAAVAEALAAEARTMARPVPIAPPAAAPDTDPLRPPEAAPTPAQLPQPPQPPQPTAVVELKPEPPAQRAPAQRPHAFVPLALGDASVQIKVAGTSAEIARARFSAMEEPQPKDEHARWDTPDLELIEKRCDLKARTCDAAAREARSTTPADQQQWHEKVLDYLEHRKALKDCFLWMVYPEREQPAPEALDVIGRCYVNLAHAARLARLVPPEHAHRVKMLQLFAEAQSALRRSLVGTWLTSPDIDQDEAFTYLNQATKYEAVYLPRYMRLADTAEPANSADLAQRLQSAESDLNAAEKAERTINKLLSKMNFHARKLADGSDPDETEHHWTSVERALNELRAAGVAGDDARVRGRLQVLRDLPALASRPALLHAAGGEPPGPEDPPAERAYSDAVARVRDMLAGQRVVMVGGEAREEHARNIEEAFELAELEWIRIRDHASTAPAEAPIRRPETRLVIILIGLANHQHVDDVAAWCAKYGKPLVRLPGKGYNPERIASEVLEQASEKLAAAK